MKYLSLLFLLLTVTPVNAKPIPIPVIEYEPTGLCYEVAIELNIAANEGIITHDEAHQVITNCMNSPWSAYI